MVWLYYTVLCLYHTIPCYTRLDYTILHDTIPYHTLPYCTIPYYIIYYTILHNIYILYYTIYILYYTILCYAMLCYAMLCYAILYYTKQVQPPFTTTRQTGGNSMCHDLVRVGTTNTGPILFYTCMLSMLYYICLHIRRASSREP